MDERLTETPKLTEETTKLMLEAENIYHENFNGEAWLGRCIFLSFHCSVGTCDFCFRSVADHKKTNVKKAERSLASIIVEALFIKAFNWRIEFLTGGYDIMPTEKIKKYTELMQKILEEKIWLNLGVMPTRQLEELKESVGGIVASLETIEKKLHKKVCPDKAIGPYIELLENADKLGYKKSITLVLGLGETREHYKYVKEFLEKHPLNRITIYALRPVKGTPYEKGPTTEEMVWWIAKTRIDFPKIEIIAGSAEYRIKEVKLLIQAGANAITKLPATKMFNTEKAKELKKDIEQINRKWISKLTDENVYEAMNWEKEIESLPITTEEKEKTKKVLESYLKQMDKRKIKKTLNNNPDSCNL